ncbi:2-oxoadipate dioxygenase/decarboxylase HglS [Vreelandella maris]|uniref:2-oxoadipate dioxygenase/decarboxylase n=1 Tax=Vreelandella maris TaxID=2729617 RepID=A0A7Y6V9D2_9GAMM|nr:VOC family protein [Halomonas maris]NVF15508.1 VOC family protein [Halomonas maris]|tara:strand:+ start:36984 stop:38357 length:1374 start_codon:yes stop_codon:yes gene_type:complete
MTQTTLLPTDDIRDRFSKAMSAMYQAEVPQYGTLLELVDSVNQETLSQQPELQHRLEAQGELARLSVERHGAIRVGTASELSMLRRLFAVMGMYPVGYYDLSEAGVPVHSTAFRPIEDEALARNPFRIFTSLLRLELIESETLRQRSEEILAKRDIFTPGARKFIERHETQDGLTSEEADQFVKEALETFRWHQDATVDLDTYHALQDEHRLIADVVCFRGPHINHLTPRTLDIDEVQRRMPEMGMNPKLVIEGPPQRECPILLRQTSFKALEESIRFAGDAQGTHTARFGEIEQRGVALTPKGRALYDQLLTEGRKQTAGLDNDSHQTVMKNVFAKFPDNDEAMRREALAYFHYYLTEKGQANKDVGSTDINALIAQGLVEVQPITYEDFLPVSAAGIFQSNLGGGQNEAYAGNANRDAFEEALGAQVTDELSLYAERERASKASVLASLKGEVHA